MPIINSESMGLLMENVLKPKHRTLEHQTIEGEGEVIVDKPSEKTTWKARINSYNPWGQSQLNEPKDVPMKRIIDRDGTFFQSRGKVVIQRKINRSHFICLYSQDWFHSLLDTPTYRIVILLMINYMIIALVFACSYYAISVFYDCNLDIRTFFQAILFSLETMSTVGYGTQDIFFGDCMMAAFVFCLQVLVSLVVTALVIGVIYHRVSRPQTRASTIVFSNKAIIRRIRGKLYFMFQLCELRQNQLVEAHIRLYSVKNETDPNIRQNMEHSVDESREEEEDWRSYQHATTNDPRYGYSSTSPKERSGGGAAPHEPFQSQYIQTVNMRLNHPNDELGGMLLLMMPQVVVHEIDAFSPLMPPSVWYDHQTRQAVRWRPPIFNRMRTKNRGEPVERNPSKASVERAKTKTIQDELLAGSGGRPATPNEIKQQSYYNIAKLSDIEYPNVIQRGTAAYPQYDDSSYSIGSPSFNSECMGSPVGSVGALMRMGGGGGGHPSVEDLAVRQSAGDSSAYVLHPSRSISHANLMDEEMMGYDSTSSDEEAGRGANVWNQKSHRIQNSRVNQQNDSGGTEYLDFQGKPIGHLAPAMGPTTRTRRQRSGSHGDESTKSSRKGLVRGERGSVSFADIGHVADTINEQHTRNYGLTREQMTRASSQPDIKNIHPFSKLRHPDSTNDIELSRPSDTLPTRSLSPPSPPEFSQDQYDPSEGVDIEIGHGREDLSSAALTKEYMNKVVSDVLDAPLSGPPALKRGFSSSFVDLQHEREHIAVMPGTSGRESPVPERNFLSFTQPHSAGEVEVNVKARKRQPTDAPPFLSPGMAQYSHSVNPKQKPLSRTDMQHTADWQREESDMIRRYLQDRQIEIIAVVEGLEPGTAGNVQARFSYTFDDMEWDKYFFNCLKKDERNGYLTIDFNRFHELSSVPYDAPYAGHII